MRYTISMTLTVNAKTQAEIGRKLREAREHKNLLQEDVAKSAGISSSYYARIERGEENPSTTVIENICRALKIKSSDVLPF